MAPAFEVVTARFARKPTSLAHSIFCAWPRGSHRSVRLGWDDINIGKRCFGFLISSFQEPLSREAQVASWTTLALRTLQSNRPMLVLRVPAMHALGDGAKSFVSQRPLRRKRDGMDATRADVSAEPPLLRWR